MHRELLAQSPLLILPIAAMFVFLGVFVAVLVRTMSKRASAYDATAALPLSEESTHE